MALAWDASTDEAGGSGLAGYRVFRDGTQVGGTLAVTQFTDVGLTAQTSYSYTVRAVDVAGNVSAASTAVQATTTAPPPTPDTTAPTVPSNLRVAGVTQTTVTMAWDASTDNAGGSGVASYRLFRNGTQVGGNITTLQFTDTALSAQTQYSYTVRAVDAAGNSSAASSAVQATTSGAPADTTPPSTPTNLRVTGVTQTTATLAWNASTDNAGGTGVVSYRLTRNGTQVGGAITVTQFTDTNLTASTAYTYTVSAVDGASNVSPASGGVQATTGSTPPTSGLDARPSNPTCLAPNEPVVNTAVSLAQVFPNLSAFLQPVAMLQAPGDNSKWYVVEQRGVVIWFDATDPNTATKHTYIDLSGELNTSAEEAGLLGMAFDPNFQSNRRVYLSYTADSTAGSVFESRISRFTESNGTLSNREILLTIQQPYSDHNGGNIAFGPDGFLYAGFGDGGDAGDPGNRSQNRATLLGKILRLDVSGSGAYAIPPGNPYASTGVRCEAGETTGSNLCQEIYAYGFRNPWRWSFDRASSSVDLWIGDVGQNTYEEVDRVQSPGGNYGWHIREGFHCYEPISGCPSTNNGDPLLDPVAEYDHTIGFSVTGGYVYRGTAIPSLVGRYVFGDYVAGLVFALDGSFQRTELLSTSKSISSFAQDDAGELYILDRDGGQLFKLVPGGGGGAGTIPTLLSQSGCFDSTDPTQPRAGLIPYAPIAPFWSDDAMKERWMALPDGQKITVNTQTGDWDFPKRTVLVKNFTLNGSLIETRLFMRFADTGNWAGYSYRWNAQHTDATLVTTSTDVTVGTQTWTYPSPAQCMQCHSAAAGRTLGLETRQLNSSLVYPTTGRTANQIDTLETIGMFTAPPTRLAPLPDPADTGAVLGDRARAYLHTNCSQCHRPGGGTQASMDLQYTTAIGATGTCNVGPTLGDLGVSGAKIIAPADPAHSVLHLRMSRRGANQMPPLASHLVDADGAALLQQWISGMNASCQ